MALLLCAYTDSVAVIVMYSGGKWWEQLYFRNRGLAKKAEKETEEKKKDQQETSMVKLETTGQSIAFYR